MFEFIGPGQKAFDRELRKLTNPNVQARKDGIAQARQYYDEYLSPDAGATQVPGTAGLNGMAMSALSRLAEPQSAQPPMKSQVVEWGSDGVTDISDSYPPPLPQARRTQAAQYADFFGEDGNGQPRKRMW